MKLFYNATFFSMNKEGETFSAVLVDREKIIETFKTVPDLATVEKIDLKKSFVYPGFIDTHTHSFEGGLYSLSANLEHVRKLSDVFEILANTEPIGGKIFAFHFDENNIKEKRFPTRKELDKIFPKIPLILRRVDGHSCVINSVAAQSINWKTALPKNFNGYLNKHENGIASNWFHKNLTDEGILQAYHKAAEIALKNGITTVHTMVGDGEEDILHYQLLQKKLNDFSVDFILYPQITVVEKALEIGANRIGGCILADGSFGSHTAALLQPYSDEPNNYGSLYHSNKFWENIIRKAHENNLQFAVHCIGDAAISQILNIYEKLQKENPKDLRHEIIHNELTSDEMLDRMATAKVSAVMQPMFDRLWAGKNGLYENRLGKERTLHTNRLASILERGILLTGGSDWYITDLNAIAGINAAAKIHNNRERISHYQAIELYTKNAAKLSFDENRIGKILPGLQADFVCLEKNILDTLNIDKIKIKSVIKKGKLIKSLK